MAAAWVRYTRRYMCSAGLPGRPRLDVGVARVLALPVVAPGDVDGEPQPPDGRQDDDQQRPAAVPDAVRPGQQRG